MPTSVWTVSRGAADGARRSCPWCGSGETANRRMKKAQVPWEGQISLMARPT